MVSRRLFLQRALAGGALVGVGPLAHAGEAGTAGLADLYRQHFYLGTALGGRAFADPDDPALAVAAREFNALTQENAMKWGGLRPTPDQWRWQAPDQLVDFGERHKMYIQGHCLVWHSQAPDWLFVDDKGDEIGAAALEQRMEEHINTLVGRYRGRIHGWDVVNEAVLDDGGWRESPWYRIMGPTYVERAFELAHRADPDCHLIYNDYNMHKPGKRQFLFDKLADFVERGVPIHGVGLQAHVGLDYPDLEQMERTIQACVELGLSVHITELDVDVLPSAGDTGADVATDMDYQASLNPYTEGLPEDVQRALADRYVALFELFMRYRRHIARVSTWGVSDRDSWKNNFPVRGRTNYPLLFDRDFEPKPAYHALRKLAEQYD